jgi:hypothetical protein
MKDAVEYAIGKYKEAISQSDAMIDLYIDDNYLYTGLCDFLSMSSYSAYIDDLKKAGMIVIVKNFLEKYAKYEPLYFGFWFFQCPCDFEKPNEQRENLMARLEVLELILQEL